MSVYHDIIGAVFTTIQALSLNGNPTVFKKKIVTDRVAEGITLPAIVVSEMPTGETVLPGTNASDDWGYPVGVTILKVCNQDFDLDDQPRLWRQQIRNAFHEKRLAGGPASAYHCRVEPLAFIDPNILKNQNLDVGGMVVRVLSREARS